MIKAYRSYYFKAMSCEDWHEPCLLGYIGFLYQMLRGCRDRTTYEWKGRE